MGQDAGNFEDRFWVAKLESWTGQLAAAESDFVRLLEERPDDYDSRIGLADVRRWRGENSAAFGVLEDLSRSHPADAEVLRRLALVSPWEASVEYFGEHLPQQASTNGIAVSLARRSSDRFRWRAATTVQDKFDRTESRFGGEVAYRPARPLELQVSAYVAPGAELLPRQSYGLSLSRKVASRLILSADYAYLDFHDAGVQQLGPALELYAGRHWLVAGRYRYSSTRFHGIEGAEGNDGGSVSLGYLYGTANLVRVVAAAGGESFTQPSRELIGQFHAHTIAAAWRHFLTPQLGFELVYARQDRSDDTRQDSYGLRMVQRW